jgi:cupin fold WbuC family metalloprotein
MEDIPKSKAIFNKSSYIQLDKKDILELKNNSLYEKRKTMRICLHDSPEATLHEMLIVYSKDAYTRPHKHIRKTETNHLISGEMDLFLFNESGDIIQKIGLGDFNSGKPFCFRIAPLTYHCILPKTDFVVFHEVTNGPFLREETIFEDWAPEENETETVKSFVMKLKKFDPNSI